MGYKIKIKPTPDQEFEVEVPALPRPGDAWIFDGMMYRAHDVIWHKIAGSNMYQPTVLLYSYIYVNNNVSEEKK